MVRRSEMRREHYKLSQRERKKRRKWRRELTENILKDCEEAMKNKDLGKFYRSLGELGIWISDLFGKIYVLVGSPN